MDKKFYLVIFIISLVYLLVRLVYPSTIEFGYDQPRTATIILDFIKNGSFITSQNFTQGTFSGSVAWGPSLVYYYLPILLISVNPLVASIINILISILSLWLIIFTATNFFNRRVALIAGLTLTLHPWWVIFSRMIYQPTPVPIFIAFSILCLFMAIKNPKSIWGGILFISYGVLFQLYLINLSFIVTSLLIYIFYSGRKFLSLKNISVGLIGNLFLFSPTILYFYKNPEYLLNYIKAGEAYKTSFMESIQGFVKTLSGGNFKWQLGYSYNEFLSKLYLTETSFSLILIIIFSIIVFGIYKIIKNKNKYEIAILSLFITPLWAVPLIGVEHVVPRYFLYVLPQFSLLFGVSLEYLYKTFGKKIIIFPLAVYLFWIYLIFNYYNFIVHYNYPNGFLSNWSDVPYSFLDSSFRWIENDAKLKGYDSYTISDDKNKPTEFSFNEGQKYYWRFILEKDESLQGKVGHYLMYFKSGLESTDSLSFGPYIVKEFELK